MQNINLASRALLGATVGLSILACSSPSGDSPSSITFDAPAILSGVTDGQRTFVADINGDKIPDLIVENDNTQNTTTYVFINDGSGHFGDPVNVPFDTLLVTDIDGDGRADLVGFSGNNVSITFSHANGRLDTEPAPNFPPLYCDFTNDFNHDGWVDALCQNNGTATAWSLNPDGSATQIFAVPIAGTITAIADIDHDGTLDFVYAIGSTVAVQLGLGNYKWGATQVVVTADEEINDVNLADIDGDGWSDMIVGVGTADDSARYFSLLRNNGGTGFAVASQFGSVDGVSYQFADFTGDGLMDVAIYQDDQLVISVGRGDGIFADDTVLVTGPWTDVEHFVFHDLNGDSKPDLIVANGSTSVLLRQ